MSTKNTAPLRIAIAGLGTVGATAARILLNSQEMLAGRVGRPLQLVAVSGRDKNKDRGFSLNGIRWESDALALTSAQDVDVVVETIGGSEGIARQLVTAALKAKKSVVTANKALLAEHGAELAALAEENGVTLAFEAAVAGGIPVIKVLREGLASNRIDKVTGILNGTSNYILSHMDMYGSSFDDALAEATRLGYAEADPSFDVDGIDAAHKLSILTALAFGCAPSFHSIPIEGIRHITKEDMLYAQELGYNIKLLGIARRLADGRIEQRVHPCMLPANSSIGVDDVLNAIQIEGDAVGRVLLEGRGAGGGATASAVVADITDIARGVHYPPYTIPFSRLEKLAFAPLDEVSCEYYLRLSVVDRPGVLGEVTRIFAENQISLCSFLQKSHQPEQAVQLVITTHRTREAQMQKAVAAINALPMVTEPLHLIRIEGVSNA